MLGDSVITGALVAIFLSLQLLEAAGGKSLEVVLDFQQSKFWSVQVFTTNLFLFD